MATILIVDDEVTNRRLLTSVLQSRGHELLEAANGEEALHLARERLPDLIILDLYLPGMHGTEFMKALRADAVTAGTNVALYTASQVDGAMRGFMELTRIQTVIEKPSEPEAILRAIDRALAQT